MATDTTISDIAVAQAAAAALNQPSVVEAPKPEPEKPKVKTCDIKTLLTASVLQLLQACPDNITIRTMAANALKRPIPDDRLTFDQIKKWVEFNPDFAKPAPPPRQDYLVVEIMKRGQETGTCSYSVDTKGIQEFRIPDSVIEQCARQAEGDSKEFYDRLVEYVRENESVTMDWNSDPYYDSHSPDEDGDGEETVEFSRSAYTLSVIQLRLKDISLELFNKMYPPF